MIFNPTTSLLALPGSPHGRPVPDPSATSLSVEDLDSPMRVFYSHLLSLLGISDLPSSFSDSLPPGIHPLQVDALLRKRVLETMKGSLHSLDSLVKLVKEQTNMRVGREVQVQVRAALKELSMVSARLIRCESRSRLSSGP